MKRRFLFLYAMSRMCMPEYWNGSSRPWMGYCIGKMYTSGLESSYIGGGTFLLNSRGFLVFCLWDSSRMQELSSGRCLRDNVVRQISWGAPTHVSHSVRELDISFNKEDSVYHIFHFSACAACPIHHTDGCDANINNNVFLGRGIEPREKNRKKLGLRIGLWRSVLTYILMFGDGNVVQLLQCVSCVYAWCLGRSLAVDQAYQWYSLCIFLFCFYNKILDL